MIVVAIVFGDLFAAELPGEGVCLGRVAESKADEIADLLTLCNGAIRHTALSAERVHIHELQGEAATGNPDRNLVGVVTIDNFCDVVFSLGHRQFRSAAFQQARPRCRRATQRCYADTITLQAMPSFRTRRALKCENCRDS